MGVYIPNQNKKLFPLSRSKVDLYFQCQKCFYLDVRVGVKRPPSFPFNLNNAVDALLKKEFDDHREAGTSHPYMQLYGLNMVPYSHPDLKRWRVNTQGVRVKLPHLNLEVYGAIDDLWLDKETELVHVVDYKATSKASEVSLDADWQIGYKRQVEFYQWLLANNGVPMSTIAWFVYLNGKRDKDVFDSKLEFRVSLLPYHGEENWVEPTLKKIKELLDQDAVPQPDENCPFCRFAQGSQINHAPPPPTPSGGVHNQQLLDLGTE